MATLTFSMPRLTQFLVDLLTIPSPTGYYHEAMDFTQQAFAELDLPDFTLAQTTKGALLMTWRGQDNTAPRGLTAHVDTLGFMVKEIKPNGALKVTNLGGILWHGAEFENVTVRTYTNQRYRGTLIPVNPSTHVNPNIVTQPRDSDNMEVRLDLKTTSAEQTRAFGIEVGDFVFVDPRIEVVDTGFIRSRFLDNKAGVAVIYEALIALKEANLRPAQDTYILIANYEEVGHGGSAGFPDGLAELLAIDMAALGHGQNSDEFHVTICVKDSSGPYHFDMNNKLRALATAHDIPHKTDIYPFYSSDGSAYWRAGGTGKVGLIGPGVASSHSYERTHVDTLEHSAHLIARYLLSE
jgi:putative aminopeptidase FrvX